jgi:hypothetical protein
LGKPRPVNSRKVPNSIAAFRGMIKLQEGGKLVLIFLLRGLPLTLLALSDGPQLPLKLQNSYTTHSTTASR